VVGGTVSTPPVGTRIVGDLTVVRMTPPAVPRNLSAYIAADKPVVYCRWWQRFISTGASSGITAFTMELEGSDGDEIDMSLTKLEDHPIMIQSLELAA
jgi:hypothetical protein